MSLFFSWHFNYETNYYLSSKCVWKEAKGVSSSHLVVTKFYCSVWICFLSNCNFSRSSWLLILLNICHTIFRPFKFFSGARWVLAHWKVTVPMSNVLKNQAVYREDTVLRIAWESCIFCDLSNILCTMVYLISKERNFCDFIFLGAFNSICNRKQQ